MSAAEALQFSPISAEESARVDMMRPKSRPLAPLSELPERGVEGAVGPPKEVPTNVPSAAHVTVRRNSSSLANSFARGASEGSIGGGSLKLDAATSPARPGGAMTIVRVAPDPPDVRNVRVRSPSRVPAAPNRVVSSATSTHDKPFSAVEAFVRRGHMRTPLQVANARHYTHTVGFYGTQMQTPRRVADSVSVDMFTDDRWRSRAVHRPDNSCPTLFTSWIERD
jgi:hypothetical protein